MPSERIQPDTEKVEAIVNAPESAPTLTQDPFARRYEPQPEKMYLSPKNSKMKFFQKLFDYASPNCHLAKFDSNVMTVNG